MVKLSNFSLEGVYIVQNWIFATVAVLSCLGWFVLLWYHTQTALIVFFALALVGAISSLKRYLDRVNKQVEAGQQDDKNKENYTKLTTR